MIRAIIFDCFGVLTADTWREFAATLPESQWQDASDIIHAYDSGFITRNEFYDGVKALTGRLPKEVESIAEGNAPKNTALLEYITALHADYKIGLLSNIATDWVRTTFLTRQEQTSFDEMVFSYQAGMAKPDPNIYRYAADKLGVAPHECVMIDDIERNCQGAREAGMQALQYETLPQLKTELSKLLANPQ